MIFFTRKKNRLTNLPHWEEVKKWIEKCIDSCQTRKQISSTYQLISLYYKQYLNQIDAGTLRGIVRELHIRRNEKWGENS
jgi:hypothetical protein